MGGIATKMIESNTTIPTSKTQIFSTAVDSQPSVQINVATGERELFKNNKFLGTFSLDVMPARRGVPQIEVEFNISADSILTVKATDKGTGKANNIRIEGSSALTKDEIERMKMEAKENAESDRIEKEKIDKLNQADSLIFQTEKQIEEFGDKLTDTDKSELNSAVEKLKESHKTQNLIDIQKYSKNLNEVWNKISAKLYENKEPKNETHEAKTDDKYGEATDVDFEEVK
jgi:molecular chaperone DnaK